MDDYFKNDNKEVKKKKEVLPNMDYLSIQKSKTARNVEEHKSQ